MKKQFLLIFYLITTLTLVAQSGEQLEYRSVESILERLIEKEREACLNAGILKDSLYISEKYRDAQTSLLTEAGEKKYLELRSKVYDSFFSKLHYQQHIEDEIFVYALYFSMTTEGILSWRIVRFDKESWNNSLTLSLEEINTSPKIKTLMVNHKKGTKQTNPIRIMIVNHYLAFERGGFYHSLYDTRTDSVLFNEERAYRSVLNTNLVLEEWIRINLHEPIESKIFEIRAD